MRKLSDYLYFADMDTHDYKLGFEYFKKFKAESAGSCSAIKAGNYIGRNLDWLRDEHVDVVIKTKAKSSVHATIGVAHSGGNVTAKNIKDGVLHYDDYATLPFSMSDCLNDAGVYCSMNVVPVGDKGPAIPVGSGPELCQLMIPRVVCDFADSALEGIQLLASYKIFAPIGSINEECHIFIADKDDAFVLEFIGGQMKIIDATIVTNFHLDGWSGDIASKCLGSTDEEIAASGLTDHAMGLERYQILADAQDTVSTIDDMAKTMRSVAYSKAYSNVNPVWYSEFYSNTNTYGDLTLYSSQEDMTRIVADSIRKYETGARDGLSWITTHTSIYDLEKQILRVYSQEDYKTPYEFKLNPESAYGVQGLEMLFSNSRMI